MPVKKKEINYFTKMFEEYSPAELATQIRNGLSYYKKYDIGAYGEMTFFEAAIRWGSADIVKACVEMGADVNEIPFPRSPNPLGMELTRTLEIAISENNAETLRALIGLGADINTNSPLIYAIWVADTEIIKILLDSGVDVNAQDMSTDYSKGVTPLMEASDRQDVVKMLLSAGANVNLQDINGETALTYAIESRNNEFMKMLIRAGADVNICDNRGVTPLITAVEYGNLRAIKILLANGADVHAQDKNGRTALEHALRKKANPYKYAQKVLVCKTSRENKARKEKTAFQELVSVITGLFTNDKRSKLVYNELTHSEQRAQKKIIMYTIKLLLRAITKSKDSA